MLKKLLKIVLSLALLLIVVVVGLAVFMNTEQYKSAIESAIASNAGYQLNIAGDLELDFFPAMRLTLNDVRLRNPAFPQELASTSAISLTVDRGQLLRGKLLVQELLADDFHINYYVDDDGGAIWDVDNPIAGTQASGESTATGDDDSNEDVVTVSFDRINIANASIDFQDLSSGSRYSVDDLNLQSSNANIEGRPFSLELDFLFLNNGMTEPVAMGLQSNVVADINNGNISVSDLNFNVTPMLLQGDIVVSNFNDDIRFEGIFESNSFDPQGLAQSLGLNEINDEFSGNSPTSPEVAFNFSFSGDQSQFVLDSLTVSIGTSEVEADASVRFATELSPAKVSYDIVADAIDLSALFPAENPDAETTTETEETTTSIATVATPPLEEPDTELPLDALNAMNMLGSIYIESLATEDLYFQDINIFTNVEDGVLDIEIQPTNAYGGVIQGAIRLDGRSTEALLSTQLSLNQLNIAEFSPSISRINSVTGQLNAEVDYTASGATINALIDSLSGSTTFAITENSVDIGVIKQVFTAIAALSPTGEAIQQWPDVIQFGELSGYILLDNGIEENQQVRLRMDNFDVAGSGGINLEEGAFDY
ncbi:MAG: AsmA family protein, partial [Gammaproteobacteria bacterium]|nr:AsmA family protein [Gammaproteobacteria bacterium]